MTEKKEFGDFLVDRRYTICNIKEGGMGTAYICYDNTEKLPVVLKTYQEKYVLNEEVIDRFLHEAAVWIHLDDHQNIVRANRIESENFRSFIVLDYIPPHRRYGLDLDDWLSRLSFPITLVLETAIQFCNGMIHAEAQFALMKKTFAHGDIKPSNIFIDYTYCVKITDFGLATVFSSSQEYGEWGTLSYMSPERIFDKHPPDICSDIYSFGTVLYQMLTGVKPYPYHYTGDISSYHAQIKNLMQTTHPKRPCQISKGIPRDLDKLVMICLEKEAGNRIQDFTCLKKKLIKIYQTLGGTYSDFGQTKSSRTIYEKTWKGVSLAGIGRYEEALQCYNRLFENKESLDDEIEYELYCARGASFEGLNMVKQAHRDYNAAMKIAPDKPFAYSLRANLLNNLGQYDDAYQYYNKAVEADSDYAIAFYNRGICYMRQGEYNFALDDFNKAISLGMADAYTNRGAIYERLELFDEAEQDYIHAVKINSRNAIAYANLAGLALRKNELDQAIDCAHVAIRVNPNYILAYLNRGSAYQRRGDSSRALDDYEKALLVTPESIIQDEGTPPAFTAEEFKSIRYLILHECGVLYWEQGNKERAIELLNEFLIDTPDEYSYEKLSVSITLNNQLNLS